MHCGHEGELNYVKLIVGCCLQAESDADVVVDVVSNIAIYNELFIQNRLLLRG